MDDRIVFCRVVSRRQSRDTNIQLSTFNIELK